MEYHIVNTKYSVYDLNYAQNHQTQYQDTLTAWFYPLFPEGPEVLPMQMEDQ